MQLVKEKSPFLDRALFQALFWSLIIHLVLFATFRIRLNDFLDTKIEMKPLNVAIEPERADEANTTLDIQNRDSYDPLTLVTLQLDPDECKMMHLAQNPVASETEIAFSDDDLSELTPELSYTPTMYPLQLKLSSELKALSLINDGSSLFKEKGQKDRLGPFMLAANHLSIDYTVTIDGKSGRVIRSDRSQVLLDKKLQQVADKIVNMIAFKPFSEKSRTGRITIVFCCTGDEIKSFMND